MIDQIHLLLSYKSKVIKLKICCYNHSGSFKKELTKIKFTISQKVFQKENLILIKNVLAGNSLFY
ncbi:hypothetical protein DU508_07435 [Pedobacter chinensis]|uniref:Uncharacterized protein n=1 Tax=Pedobacter chinensis TaxID=2282421 RepID=A0A369PWF6_9SPHI|nr:hypothetical protein DU508_07435 [Pedobacter chinensis]